MKKLTVSLCLLLFAFASVCKACWSSGYVLCDANQNGVIDSADTPVPSVLVIVTNVSGTYSNANWTMPDGLFMVQLQTNVNDTYVEYIDTNTLPADSTFLFPIPPTYTFSIDVNTNPYFAGSFLINNPACQSNGGCWLTGGGTVGGTARRPDHNFGGNVYPGCSSTAGDGGQWTDISRVAKLRFQGTVVQTVDCGNVVGYPPGSSSPVTPFNLIDFTGFGTLKGIAGNKADYGTVYFTARAEDHAEPGRQIDRYYLRVYAADGTTLMLVSGDTSNPTNIVTVPISTGNLQLHESSCP